MKKSSKQLRLNEIKNKICKFELLAPGRLRTTRMRCGNPGCACRKDKNARHGPYHLWDRKVGDKLTSKMVSADTYKKIANWIRERKKIEALIVEAIKISQEIISEEVDGKKRRK